MSIRPLVDCVARGDAFSRGRTRTLGWFGEDIVDGVEDVVTSAWDDAKSTVPGLSELSDVIDAAVTGPIRDFAKGPIGRVLFTAMASTLTGGLAAFVGPQVATVAFALPGLARGDDFVTAWTQEFTSRVQQTAAILGPQVAGPLFEEQLGKINDYIAAHGIDLSQVDFRALAEAAGVREDVAAWVIAGAVGELDLFQPNAYDPVTGMHVPTKSAIQKAMEMAEQAAQRAASLRAHAISKAAAVKATAYQGHTFADLIANSGAVTPSVDRATAPAGGSRTGLAGDLALAALVVGALGAVYLYTRR